MPGCGVSHDTMKWMESIQNSAYLGPTENGNQNYNGIYELAKKEVTDKTGNTHNPLNVHPAHKYSQKANDQGPRAKRSPRENPNKRKSCSLYIQTDPLFWQHIREQASIFIHE